MICKKCGEKNLDGSSKCKKCGSSLKSEELALDKEKNNADTISKNTRIKLCKCGTLIQDDWDICPNCGVKLDSKLKKERNLEDIDYGLDTSGGNILMIIFITCYLFPHLLTGFVKNYEYVFIIFRITCFILITTAKVNYPENNKVKVLFWLFLLAVTINIILMVMNHSLDWKF